MASDQSNPYSPPGKRSGDIPASRSLTIPLACSVPIAALGSGFTSWGMESTSVTWTILPLTFSFSASLWLVLRHGLRSYPIRSAAILIAGAIIGLLSTSAYLDYVDPTWRLSSYTRLVIASTIGAVAFSIAVLLSSLSSKRRIAVCSSFASYAFAAFMSLLVIQENLLSAQFTLIIFLCSICFHMVMIGAIAFITWLDSQSGEASHQSNAGPT